MFFFQMRAFDILMTNRGLFMISRGENFFFLGGCHYKYECSDGSMGVYLPPF